MSGAGAQATGQAGAGVNGGVGGVGSSVHLSAAPPQVSASSAGGAGVGGTTSASNTSGGVGGGMRVGLGGTGLSFNAGAKASGDTTQQ